MGVRALPLVAVLLLALALPTQAALNGPRPYESSFPFQTGFVEAGGYSVLSGALDGRLGPTAGSFGFFDTDGTRITGLTRVCWGVASGQCRESPTGGLELRVADGGSFGLRSPVSVAFDLEAAHALTLFIDFGGDPTLNTFGLGRAVVAATVGGEARFGAFPPITAGAVPDSNWGGVTGLSTATRIDILLAGAVVGSLQDKEAPAFFLGQPQVAPIAAGLVVAPFGSGESLTVTAASEAAAREGLDIARLQDLLNDLDEADPETADGNAGEITANTGLDQYRGLLAAILDGAVLGLTTGGNATGEDFVLVRFESLEARSTAVGVALTARSPLAIEDAHVQGASKLVGPGFYAMPWWSFLLWGIAIAMFVTRLVLRVPRKNQRWDRFRWVGWVAGPLAFLLVFFLWDLETRAVWGTSLLAGDATGRGLLAILVLQVVPYLGASFAVAAPLRMIFRNGFLLGRQGTFMGLAGTLAQLLGFLFGAHLLRAYLDLYLNQVIANLG